MAEGLIDSVVTPPNFDMRSVSAATATPHLGTCTTGAAGVCAISGLAAPGSYIVSETRPPTGYTGGPDQTVTITTSPGVTSVAFVDALPGQTD
jgi:hypothetical protein